MNKNDKTESAAENAVHRKAGDIKTPPAVPKGELRRRERTIRTTNIVFKAIDVLYSGAQNSCPYVTKKNVGSIVCEKDVVYDDSDKKICLMDVYSVPTAQKLPAIIIIHGGGFSAGGKRYRVGQSQFFALNRFKVFCVDYGLAPEYIFPAPINQLVVAANHIYSHADEYNIDKNKIIVTGDSAGAYYASMLCVLSSINEKVPITTTSLDFRFAGAMLVCGLYDLSTVLENKYFLDLDEGVMLSFTGMTKKELDTFVYRDVCMPIEHIESDFPPSFVIYSPFDIFCKGQGEALLSKLEANGVYTEHYAARHSGSNHCFNLTWRGEDASAANELALSFAKRIAADKIKF